MIKRYHRLLLFISLICGFCLNVAAPTIANAITPAEFKSIVTAAPYYDPLSGNGCQLPTATLPSTVGGSLATGSSVYILGDSITVGTSPAYQTAFQLKGLIAKIDGSSSRSINGPGIDGNKLNGMDAVEQDKTDIATAKVIVVALGTNGGNTSTSITALVAAIRAHNPSAPLYWIDTTVIGRASYVSVIKAANLAIYNEAAANGYEGHIIQWFNAVTPGADAQNPTGSETDTNGYINLSDGINVHPTAKGKLALADLVVNTLAGGPATPSPTTGATCLTGSNPGGPLAGADNAAKIYNYLKSKGLTPVQISGIMGNLQAESGFNPQNVQNNAKGIPDGPEIPINAVTTDGIPFKGHYGYGIAQWTTAGRQQALVAFAAMPPPRSTGDLSLQLDFLWQELSTSYKGSVLTPLQGATDIRVATDIVLKHFECPQACVDLAKNPTSPAAQAAYQSVVDQRTANALKILTQFGST